MTWKKLVEDLAWTNNAYENLAEKIENRIQELEEIIEENHTTKVINVRMVVPRRPKRKVYKRKAKLVVYCTNFVINR